MSTFPGSNDDVARPVFNKEDALLIRANLPNMSLTTLLKLVPPRDEYEEKLEAAMEDEAEYLKFRARLIHIIEWRLKRDFGV